MPEYAELRMEKSNQAQLGVVWSAKAGPDFHPTDLGVVWDCNSLEHFACMNIIISMLGYVHRLRLVKRHETLNKSDGGPLRPLRLKGVQSSG